MTVGQMIKTERCRMGLTQMQVAVSIGYKSRDLLSKLERDELIPTEKCRRKLEEFFLLPQGTLDAPNDIPYEKVFRAEKTKSGNYKSKGRARDKYNSEHYDAYNIKFRKGDKEKYQSIAFDLGYESFNQFCMDAINEKIERSR